MKIVHISQVYFDENLTKFISLYIVYIMATLRKLYAL